ncbi:aldehyde dehydrogenase family protein [Bradyrhizobium sp. CCBAU 53415]|uniref:aldehyde dehydrogenase family protein n=1 Tax=Bradyrhizobium sp. CCBAU 53415 TaxID=1325119 RepID=UPI003FA4D110
MAASVWTSSLHRAERARRLLVSGIVWINCAHTLSTGTPIGGHKASGLGIEHGVEAAEQYMKVKTSVIMSGGWHSPFSIRRDISRSGWPGCMVRMLS